MGAVGVPLNVAVRGDALRRALTNSGARVLAVDPALLPVLGVVDLPAGLEQVWQAAARRRVAWSGSARQAAADQQPVSAPPVVAGEQDRVSRRAGAGRDR
jgi:hypothetical protein